MHGVRHSLPKVSVVQCFQQWFERVELSPRNSETFNILSVGQLLVHASLPPIFNIGWRDCCCGVGCNCRPKVVLAKRPVLLNEHVNRTPYVPPPTLDVGTALVAMDNEGNWYTAKVMMALEGRVQISFDGWSDRCDEWILSNSTRLRESLHLDVLLEARAAAAATTTGGGGGGGGKLKRKAVDPAKSAADKERRAKQAAEKKAAKARRLAAMTPKPLSSGAGTNRLFIVEEVLNHRVVDETLQYFIKWKDYEHTENTWEPSTNLPKDSLATFQISENGMFAPIRYFYHLTKASAQTLKKIAKKFNMTDVDLLDANVHIPGISLNAKLRVGTNVLVPENCVGDLGGERMDGHRERQASASNYDGGGGGGPVADVSLSEMLGESTAALLSPSTLKDVFSGIVPSSSPAAAVGGGGASAGAVRGRGARAGLGVVGLPGTAAQHQASAGVGVDTGFDDTTSIAAEAAAAVTKKEMDEIDALSLDLLG